MRIVVQIHPVLKWSAKCNLERKRPSCITSSAFGIGLNKRVKRKMNQVMLEVQWLQKKQAIPISFRKILSHGLVSWCRRLCAKRNRNSFNVNDVHKMFEVAKHVLMRSMAMLGTHSLAELATLQGTISEKYGAYEAAIERTMASA
jgi:hypothetical protein